MRTLIILQLGLIFSGLVVAQNLPVCVEWGFGYEGTGQVFPTKLLVASDGSIYSTGNFVGPMAFDQDGTHVLNSASGNNTSGDSYVAKYDEDGNLLWAFDIGNRGFGWGIAEDDKGDIYTTGWFKGTEDFDPGLNTFNLTSNGSNDIYVAKYTSNGNFIRAFSFGGTSSDIVRSVEVDHEGNLIVAGHFRGTVDFDPGPGTTSLTEEATPTVFVAKYDSLGNFLWVRAPEGTIPTGSNAPIVLDVNGNIYTLGSTNSLLNLEEPDTLDFDPSEGEALLILDESFANEQGLIGAEETIGFIVKYDADGNFLDLFQFPNTFVAHMDFDREGNIVLSGNIRDTADISPLATTVELIANGDTLGDAFLAKYDSDFQHIWSFSMGGSDRRDGLANFVIDTANSIYASGNFHQTVNINPLGTETLLLNDSLENGWVLKYDENGQLIYGFDINDKVGSARFRQIGLSRSSDLILHGTFTDTLINISPSDTFEVANTGTMGTFLVQYNQFACPSACRERDSLALVDLYNATDGLSWTTTWDLNQPIDTWFGVTLNAEGCVTRLVLDDNNLVGAIPTALGDLHQLNKLILSGNNLTGFIPPELGQLTELTVLSLNNNNLTDTMPSELWQLTKLQQLVLSDNSLSGSLSNSIGNLTSLTILSLSNNNLTDPLPLGLENLSQLKRLILSGNNFTGTILVELGDLSNLTQLLLNSNNLTGAIPPELGQLSELQLLYLGNNNLEGAIPSELWQLTKLQQLVLSSNNFSGNLSEDIGDLTDLSILRVGGNMLEGALPDNLWTLNKLGFLSVSNNQFSGSIPSAIGNLTLLTLADFDRNDFDGVIPAEFGDLVNLQRIRLENNMFTGGIPASIGGLPELTYLTAYNNELSGCFPASLLNLCDPSYTVNFDDNSNLPNNGDFDLFCATSSGICPLEADCLTINPVPPVALECLGTNINLGMGILASGLYPVEEIATSNNTIAADSCVSITATELVHLLPGFKVEAGGSFTTHIAPCNSSSIVEVTDRSEKTEESTNFSSAPTEIQLSVYPNPFTNHTNIKFNLPKASRIRLSIYHAYGQLIQQIEGDYANGTHEIPFKPYFNLANGIYFVHLQTPEDNIVHPMLLKN